MVALKNSKTMLLKHAASMRENAAKLLRGVPSDKKKRLREAADRVREYSARFSSSGLTPNPWEAKLHAALSRLAAQINAEVRK